MATQEWKNPVAERDADARGVYVAIWTGYRWEYFAGPFASNQHARQAVEHWEDRYGLRSLDCWSYEMLDGEK